MLCRENIIRPDGVPKPPAPVRCTYAMEILRIDWKDIGPAGQPGLPQKELFMRPVYVLDRPTKTGKSIKGVII